MDAKADTSQQAQAPLAYHGHDPLIVFDGICVLCSSFAQFVVRFDRAGKFRFATAQSPLGEALYNRYGLRTDIYETNIVIIDGVAYQRLDSLIAVLRCARLAMAGGARLEALAAPDPRPAVRDDRAQPLRAVRQEGELRHTVRSLASEDH